MPTTPNDGAPGTRAADDVPTAPPLGSMAEAYPLTIGVHLEPETPTQPGDDRWRASLIIGPVSGLAPDRALSTSVAVPGSHTGRDGALRAASSHLASKLT